MLVRLARFVGLVQLAEHARLEDHDPAPTVSSTSVDVLGLSAAQDKYLQDLLPRVKSGRDQPHAAGRQLAARVRQRHEVHLAATRPRSFFA